MAVGHITLDGVEYALRSQNDIQRANSNQMAAKLGSGAGDYDDQQSWAGWLMDSWEAGVGKLDPDAGGFLAATAETRFKRQLALPSICRTIPYSGEIAAPTTTFYSENLAPLLTDIVSPVQYVSIPVGGASERKKLSNGFRLAVDPTPGIEQFDILLPGVIDNCTEVIVELWRATDYTAEDAGYPDTLYGTTTITLREEPGWYWYHVSGLETDSGAFVDSTWYQLVIYPSAGILYVPTIDFPMDHSYYYYEGAEIEPSEGWTQWGPEDLDIKTSSFLSYWHTTENAVPSSAGIVHAGDYNYIPAGTGAGSTIYVSDLSGLMDAGTSPSATITDIMALDGRVYLGQGDSTNYLYMADDGTTTTSAAAVPANKLTMFNGFLWRSVGADLFYTDDEVTWVTVPVGLNSREQITNMAGLLDGTLFVTTNRSMYIVNDGDIVQWISNFGAPKVTNGKYMINFQGQVYFSMGETLMRFDGDNLLPIGPDLEEGLPEHHAGEIVGIAANNNWLVVAIAGATGSVWAYNGQGWHFLAELPTGVTCSAIGYSHEDDAGFAYFVVAGPDLQVYYISAADTRKTQRRAAAIANSDFHYHHYTGWLETSWFYGGLREVYKDWESVYLDGQNIGTDNFVEVYWQEEEGDTWQLLGTVDQPTEELRWSNYATRPEGRRIRVGLALYNSFQPGTPLVTAVRIKYQPMLIDRWRWQITITTNDNQDLLDGQASETSGSAMVAHLDRLSKQVHPFILGDTDGTQYEVKMMTMTRQPEKVEYMAADGSVEVHYVYSLSVEQVIAEEYQSV